MCEGDGSAASVPSGCPVSRLQDGRAKVRTDPVLGGLRLQLHLCPTLCQEPAWAPALCVASVAQPWPPWRVPWQEREKGPRGRHSRGAGNSRAEQEDGDARHLVPTKPDGDAPVSYWRGRSPAAPGTRALPTAFVCPAVGFSVALAQTGTSGHTGRVAAFGGPETVPSLMGAPAVLSTVVPTTPCYLTPTLALGT